MGKSESSDDRSFDPEVPNSQGETDLRGRFTESSSAESGNVVPMMRNDSKVD
jgi:hypothetical protein